MEISLTKFTHCKLQRCQTLRRDLQITVETVRPSNWWPLKKLQTFSEIYPQARLIRHILYSIMSAWVNLDSSKSRARIALVMSSVTSLQTNRQDVDISKLSKVTNQKVYRNEVFKTMLTGSPVAPSFSTRPGLSPPRIFNRPDWQRAWNRLGLYAISYVILTMNNFTFNDKH